MVKILEMAHNWSTWLKVRNGPKQSKTLIGQMTQFSKLPNCPISMSQNALKFGKVPKEFKVVIKTAL